MNIVQLIKDVAEEMDADFRSDYSGRCMYGRECVGVVTDQPFEFCLQLGINIGAQGDTSNQPTDIRSDSMGRSTIIYFPGIEADQDEEKEICPVCKTEVNDENGECECPD